MSRTERQLGIDRKVKNKAIRQENLRDQLSAQGHVQHVTELIKQILDHDVSYEKDMLERTKIALNAKFRLIDKYLPDLKSTEVIQTDGTDLASLLREAGRLAQSIASDQRKAERELQSADVVSEQPQVQPSIKAIK